MKLKVRIYSDGGHYWTAELEVDSLLSAHHMLKALNSEELQRALAEMARCVPFKAVVESCI